MKKRTERTITFCDACENDDSVYYHCAGCAKDFCYKCQDKDSVGQKFIHAVRFSGSCDCFLCMDCLAKPTPAVKVILAAYLKIQQLRNEAKVWGEDFDKRCKTAEAKVEEVAKKYNIK